MDNKKTFSLEEINIPYGYQVVNPKLYYMYGEIVPIEKIKKKFVIKLFGLRINWG